MNTVFLLTRLETIYTLRKDIEVGRWFKKAPKHTYVVDKCSVISKANNGLKAFHIVIIFENIPSADPAP